MASMTSAININVDTKIKNEATAILKGLGLNMSTFINMALTQVVKRNGVPFEVVNPTPSKEMLEALAEGKKIMQEVREGKRHGYNNVNEMMRAILND